MGRSRRSLVWCALATLVWLASVLPTSVGGAPAHAAAEASSPTVGDVALATTTVAGWPLYYDVDVPPAALAQAGAAFEHALTAVPRITELPPFQTPMAVYLLADDARFRAALEEIGGVRIELVALEIGGYTIE